MSKDIPQGIVIAKFSAHNRIARSSSASAALKALVLSYSGTTGPKAHTTFDLKWATEDLPERRLAQMKRALCAAKSRAAIGSKYRAEVEAGIKALSGSARLCDVLELGRRAAYAATAAVIITSCLVLCIAMHIAGILVSSVRRVSLVSVPAAVPKVLVIVVGIYFLAQCATSLEFTPSPPETYRMGYADARVLSPNEDFQGSAGNVETPSVRSQRPIGEKHARTSPSEHVEETDPSWAASCTFRPDYAPVCETPYPGKWYLKLAEQGKLRNAREQYELGKMYYEGRGVALDLTEAAKWYRESAEQGDADAQLRLGRMYQYGNGVALDLVEAAKWFRKSASQGNASAQFALGSIYQYGTGVELDLTEAAKWYRKSAEQGDALAQFALGHMHYTGKGVSLDLTEAARWYRESASQGNALSQFWLGTMYSDGQGVALDPVEAAKWYERAKSAS
jgi:TPR repeat protein